MESDLEPLIIASSTDVSQSGPGETSSESWPEHQHLRGPSLDTAADLGVSVRGNEDRIADGISLRNEAVNDDNTKLDDMKQFSMSHHNNVDETDLKHLMSASSRQEYTVVNEHDQNGRSTQEDDLTGRDGVSNCGYVDSDLILSINAGSSEPWFASRLPVQNNTGIAPPLSEGKLYHVFFSYVIEDRDWVREIVDRLESPELGFRCSTHERDFHPGKRITENITEHITVSEKTVIVLSPDFLESTWCKFEIELGMVLSMEEKQMLLIPVMVRNCEIPNSLKPLTYVDATSDQGCWFQKLLEVVSTKVYMQNDFNGRREFTIQPRYGNMDLLAEITSSFSCRTGDVFAEAYMPDVLMRPGIQISQDKFHEAILRVQTGYPCLFSLCCDSTVICIYLLVELISTAVGGIVFFMTYQMPDYGLFLLMIIPVVIFGLVWCLQRRLRHLKLKKDIIWANRVLIEDDVLVGATVATSPCSLFRRKILFWYYGKEECTRYLFEFLQETETCVNANSTEIAQTQAKKLIIEHSAAYTRAYTEGRLKPTHGTRHVRNAICLCQFIENAYV